MKRPTASLIFLCVIVAIILRIFISVLNLEPFIEDYTAVENYFIIIKIK